MLEFLSAPSIYYLDKVLLHIFVERDGVPGIRCCKTNMFYLIYGELLFQQYTMTWWYNTVTFAI